ncbi:protein of unknown function [Taphrina deformans PYCC 5710]|uniref:DNA polymerase epsilon subunit B n=1 Tax=Taphrina deformans (strain PYCC 5710 / ATCC 11124 / CBS 356.35 / IMI 108563 / JCM 9778 / NBRC 8474) TaxID=1097556 RepID=R4XEP9_TAPDE|nr:protein of unknown function [Taphrina deformans PYCC 5710]|eukprot:CCG84123.1 protein of unknown function [Taphrina deformans PYCC 5710]
MSATAAQLPIAPLFANNLQSRTSLAVKIEPSQLRPLAFRVFTKKYNLTLKSDALKVLATFVGTKCGQSWRASCEPVLDEIAKSWKRTQDAEPIVSEAGLLPIIKSLDVPHVPRPSTLAREDTALLDSTAPSLPSTIDPKQYLTYIDAFDQPILQFSHLRHTFEHSDKKPTLLPDAVVKPQLWSERYHALKARILRHESFQAPSFQNQTGQFHKLTSIKNLLGRQGKSFMLFGLLITGVDSKYYLEDSDDSVELDFGEATCGGGWFCPGCFVLVDGTYTEDETFLVSVMGQPPPEPREQTREIYSGVDFLGTGIERSQERHLARAEQSYKDARIVFCADCHLDDPRSVKAVKSMLASYEFQNTGSLPLAIVMLGNFVSHAHHTNGSSTEYKGYWDNLAAVLQEFPKLCEYTRFVFVPGSNDPWSLGGTSVLPRRAIPKTFVNRISRICKFVTYASNPSRLNYFTQEIVLCRDDMVERLRRNNITLKRPPLSVEEDDEMADDTVLMHDDGDTQTDTQAQVFATPNLATGTAETAKPSVPREASQEAPQEIVTARTLIRTILDQSHLSPFPVNTRPIYWSHSSSLRLFPAPTVLVLADTAVAAFSIGYNGTLAINPGKICWGKEGGWMEYEPATRTCKRQTCYIH